MPRNARWVSARAPASGVPVSRVSAAFAISACPGKVGTGFPIRTCAKLRNLERAAQVFIEQALIDQPAPVEGLLELADGDEPVVHRRQSLLGEIAAAPVLPLVVFRQDGAGFGRRHLPDLGVAARGLLPPPVHPLDPPPI